jgi:hypothetical protein
MPQERACHEAIYMLPDQVVPEAQYAWQLVLFLTDGPGGPVYLAAGPFPNR